MSIEVEQDPASPGEAGIEERAASAPRAVPSPAERIVRVACWLVLGLVALYAVLARGHFVGTDEIAVYQATRSLWQHGDLRTGRIVNTAPGRAGLDYSVFSAGQSFAALPLYGLATGVKGALLSVGADDWVKTFAGPDVGTEPSRWGGDIEMFFVGFWNTFIVALLCGVFFAFSLRLGASIGASAAAAALLGLTSYVAPSATNFLQHPSEALFLLWTFYFLFADSRRPDWRSRCAAGATLALSIMLRWESVIAVPWLGLYLLWVIWDRRQEGGGVIPSVLRQVPAFAAPLLVGLAFPPFINWVRFESVRGVYGDVGFNSPFPTGLYTFLFSSGDSMFIFTPLLLLLPSMFVPFLRRWRREAVLVAVLCTFYLVFYASYRHWHGLWSDLGPRFLVPTVPFLLLPLAGWLDAQRRRGWMIVGALALVGLWVQFVHFAANFSYVSYFEGLVVPVDRQIPWDFLFRPDRAPILAHSRATLAWDYRVDLWLVNVYRAFGLVRMLVLAVPLILLLAFSVRQLVIQLRALDLSARAPEDLRFTSLARPSAIAIGAVVAVTLVGVVLG